MSVKVVNYTPRVTSNIVNRASQALRLIAGDIVRIARPITPYKTGDLSRSTLVTVSRLHGRVEWRKRYASVQELGRRRGAAPFRHYTTPGTGKKYAERAVRQVIRGSSKYFKRVGL